MGWMTIFARALATVVMLGVSAPALSRDTQWEGSRTDIKAFVAKQKGMLDLPHPIAFYGDFNGDRREDAIVFIYRDIAGAAGNFDLRVALFEGSEGRYRLLRLVPGVYGTEPRQVAFSNGLIEITTTILRPEDSRCCPTGSMRHKIRTSVK